MAIIPDAFLDLLEQKKAFGHLATLMPDGSPQVTPVWFDYRNGLIHVSTLKGSVKARNMQQRPSVALSILDPDDPYRYIQIRGRVTRFTEEAGTAHIDLLAKKYLGQDKYPWARPGDVHMIFEIEPASASVMG
jgi:PPOX class probable F420-dependent enzyme